MEYFRRHKRGFIGTAIFHIIVLLLLIFLGFFTPLPLPGEEGIMVNFGTSDSGSGDIEPSPARNNPAPSQPVQREEKKEVPPPVTKPATSPPKTVQQTPAKEVAMTQDYEKTAAIEAAEKKKKEDEIKRQQQLAEERRQKQIREEQQRREEQERIRKQQEEAERIRKAEAERKAKEEEQRKINEINSRVQGAFAESGTGTGGQGSGTGKSQGATFPGGNQGVPTGGNNGNYGQGGSGSGNSGSGPSFSLSGRSAVLLPIPNYPGNDEGMVVVKITVDKNGKVTNAEPGVQGTTIMNQRFWNEAKQAALKAKFNTSENAPAYQQGTISYRFVLD